MGEAAPAVPLPPPTSVWMAVLKGFFIVAFLLLVVIIVLANVLPAPAPPSPAPTPGPTTPPSTVGGAPYVPPIP